MKICQQARIVVFLMLMFVVFAAPERLNAYFSYDARAAGMGGAFSAVVDDASGVYWNPAGLALIPAWSITMTLGQGWTVGDNVQDTLERIHDMNPASDPTADYSKLIKDLNKLNEFSWIHRGGNTFGFCAAHQNGALSIMGYDVFYVQPVVDTTNIDPDTSLPTSIQNNSTQLELSGYSFQEYGLSYAWLSMTKAFAFGITAKYVDIKGYDSLHSIWGLDSVQADDLFDVLDSAPDYTESEWGLDAGMLIRGAANRLSIVVRNLRKYTIDISDDVSLEVKPEYRIGYAFVPNDRFIFAVDYSLSKNRDPFGNKLDGKDISMGFEGKFGEKKHVILRGGATIEPGGDMPVVYSGGFGLEFKYAKFDISYSTDQDGETKSVLTGMRFSF